MTPENKLVPIGTRFNGGECNYIVEEKLKEPKKYLLRCETAGTIGNQYYGLIQPVFNVNGLQRAEIIDISIPGEDTEDVEEYRTRLKNAFSAKPFGGNYQDYYQAIIEIQGVGGLKVIGTPKNVATIVDVYIIDSEYKKPTPETIAFVQEQVHPILPEYTQPVLENSGSGFAPIGHVVTIYGVRERQINVKTNISFNDTFSWSLVQEEVESVIADHFKQLCKDWAENNNIVIKVSSIAGKILEVEGVSDVWGTTINGEEINLALEFDEIPILGTVENENDAQKPITQDEGLGG